MQTWPMPHHTKLADKWVAAQQGKDIQPHRGDYKQGILDTLYIGTAAVGSAITVQQGGPNS